MIRLNKVSVGSSFAARFAAGVLLAGLLTAAQTLPLRADEVDDLRDEVQQLKQQMTYLQNQIPGAGAGAGSSSGGGTIAAQQEVRMQQLTQQMSQLQGQIEQLGIKVDDLSGRLDQMQKDTQFRLGQLEQGGAVAGATGAAAAATPGAPASVPAAPSAGATVAQPTPLPQSADQMGTGGLPGPEGTTQQLPQPTAPGTLGTISQNAPLPTAPAGAAEAAAAAAAQSQSAAVVNADPNSVQLPGNTPQEQYEYATGLLQRGAYPEAGLAFKAFVTQHPKDALAGNAQYWLGETYYAQSDYKNAAIAFAEGYQKYPKSSKAPDNLLKLGMSLGQTGRKADACTAFKQLASQFPSASGAIKDRTARAQQRYGCSS
jgi:tol-pal system protein YbgF